jgi:hypothetical protein
LIWRQVNRLTTFPSPRRRLFGRLTESERLKRPAGWRILGVEVVTGFLVGFTLFAFLIQTWGGSAKSAPGEAPASGRA